MQFIAKVFISAVVLVFASEIAKRSSWLGALITSLPLSSLLAFMWLYWDTGSATQVASLSRGIFWMILPSLSLFLLLPFLIERGWSFGAALGSSCLVLALTYGGFMRLLQWWGVRL